MDELDMFKRLGLALAIGLLLGVERGWQRRDDVPGSRVAGVRSFALIGLLGGLWALLGLKMGDSLLGMAFLAFSALVVTAHVMRLRQTNSLGITTEIAELVTFCLGAVAVRVDMALAAAGGVVTLALLSLKPVLHGWVARLQEMEVAAATKLLLISVVFLPLLPNEGFGPGLALNPYKLWLVVVMIAAISFVGYFAIKIAGPRIGTLLTGFFGGLASSTALTLSFSRIGKTAPDLQRVLAAGVAVAAGTMFLRILLIVVLLNPSMTQSLALPMGMMALVCYVGAAVLWFDRGGAAGTSTMELQNPFELGTAVKFGLLLAVIMVAARLLKSWIGDQGLYLLAAVSGIADVDAIAISMANQAGVETAFDVAALAIVIGSFVNTITKGGMVVTICGGAMATRIFIVFGAAILAGGAALVLG